MPVPDYVKRWLNYLVVELNLSKRTVFDYYVSAVTFLRWIKHVELNSDVAKFKTLDVSDVPIETIAALDRDDIYEFLSFCSTTLNNSESSRACKLAAIRSMFNYLTLQMRNSCVTENPTANVSAPKKEKHLPKYLTIEEAKQLLSAVEGEAAARDYCMILWFLSCGMRLSELVAINMKDVRNETLKVFGKGKE